MIKKRLILLCLATLAITSCATVFYPYRFVFINDSSHTVTVNADGKSFTLKPGQKESFSSQYAGSFYYWPEDEVAYETSAENWYDHYWEMSRSLQRIWFYDR